MNHEPDAGTAKYFRARLPMQIATCVAVAAVALAASMLSMKQAAAQTAGNAPDVEAFDPEVFAETHNRISNDILNEISVHEPARDLLPEKIKASGKMLWASRIGIPPGYFLAPDGKTPIGYEYTLMVAISRVLGLEPDVSTFEWQTLIPSLEAGRVDAIMALMNDTEEREQKIDFINYIYAGLAFVIPKDNPRGLTRPEDFCGLTITSTIGGTQEAFAKQISEKCVAAGKGPVTVMGDNNIAQAQIFVMTRRADVHITDGPSAGYSVATRPDDLELLETPEISHSAQYGIAVRKSDDTPREAIQAALQHLMDTGAYQKIMQAWELDSVALDVATINAIGAVKPGV